MKLLEKQVFVTDHNTGMEARVVEARAGRGVLEGLGV